MSTITPQILLKAYAAGIFPMAESAEDNALYWVEPEERGIFPLDDLRISRSLRKRIRQRRFDVRVDTAFNDVIAACAEKAPDRKTTWINQRIKSLYGQLYRMGCCHSIECWRSNRLVGGVGENRDYGREHNECQSLSGHSERFVVLLRRLGFL